MTDGRDLRALLVPEEAAVLLGVPMSRLKKWRTTGLGPPFVRISAQTIRYRLKELEEFLEPNRALSHRDGPARDGEKGA